MERKLSQLISTCEKLSDIRNLSPDNPIILRISNPITKTLTVIVCALEEPVNLILPLNVLWFDFNPISVNYRKALMRVNKEPDPAKGNQFTWKLILNYDEIFEEQYYDSADEEFLTGTVGVVPASTTDLGIARLSTIASNPADPIVISNTDPRLTDARNPLPHTHPPQPAISIKTNEGEVFINQDIQPQQGMVLFATSSSTAEWRFLKDEDIVG